MKFNWLGILTIVLITGAVHAQSVNIGIKGGLNVYTLQDDNSASDRNVSFHAGLLAHIHLASHFALQPEVVYSVQGGEFKGLVDNPKLNLTYINVPLLFQYMFDNGCRLQAGPQVGFLVKAESQVNSTNSDVKNDYKNTDVGIVLGASYVHPPSGFGIDARYNYGFTPINATSTVNLYNRGFQVGLFLLLRHKS
jgi:hypothetical protein